MLFGLCWRAGQASHHEILEVIAGLDFKGMVKVA
jgi:hypothetical protein